MKQKGYRFDATTPRYLVMKEVREAHRLEKAKTRVIGEVTAVGLALTVGGIIGTAVVLIVSKISF